MSNKLKEELEFSFMMMFGMVTIMLSYNSILISGFSLTTLKMILSQFIPIFIMVFFVEQLFVSHNVQKLHKILVSPEDPKFKHEIIMILLMVTGMCASMTMYTSLIYVGTGNGFWHHYLFALIRNYPVALISQMFIVGPLVRFLFVKINSKPALAAQQTVS